MTKQPNSSSMLMLAACVFSLLLSSSVNAQLVFNKSDIDGSFGQPNVLDAGTLSHGLQPFEVTPALASANGIEYNGAFSADPVLLPGNILTGLDVRTWSTGFIYLSNATDALNGTPTARAIFNPLESTAPNGQQFQDLIIETQGSNGEIHYTFDPVANLGFSQENNPYHQITEVLDMNTTLIMQDNSTTTLGSFLADNVGQTLYGSSIINNATSGGSYDIAATPNLGLNGIIFNQQGGFEVEAGFAHSFTEVESVLLGDVNLDGGVNFLDISPFIAILTTGDFQDEADLDQNGSVNFLDISPFIAALSSQ